MQVTPLTIRPLAAPKDSLLEALAASKLSLKDGDIIAISSKVVAIHEGATVPLESVHKEDLIRAQAQWYQKGGRASKWRTWFTIAGGVFVGSAGVDESNGNGHYILYPKDAFKSARTLRNWLMKTYGVRELGVIITDSMSTPLRRGAIGFALAWDGIDPLRDYRGTKDIFGRTIKIELANLIDALAASAVLVMGEGAECTPVAVIRDAQNIRLKNRAKNLDQLIVSPEDDIFAPLFWNKRWNKGGSV